MYLRHQSISNQRTFTFLLFAIIHITTLTSRANSSSDTDNTPSVTYESTIPWNTYYWELKPYIYTGQDKRLTGMIVDYFEEQRRAGIVCFQNKSKRIIAYTGQQPNRESVQTLENDNSLQGYVLPILGVTNHTSWYAPISADSVSLVARRMETELSYKIAKALLTGINILYVVMLTSSLIFAFCYMATVSSSCISLLFLS